MLTEQLRNLGSLQNFPSGSFDMFWGNHLCTKVKRKKKKANAGINSKILKYFKKKMRVSH